MVLSASMPFPSEASASGIQTGLQQFPVNTRKYRQLIRLKQPKSNQPPEKNRKWNLGKFAIHELRHLRNLRTSRHIRFNIR